MKRIQCLNDMDNLSNKFPKSFLDYLKCEFIFLYEMYNNGEEIEEFKCGNHHAIIIVEEVKELVSILQDKINLEYVDELHLNSTSCLRIGINVLEDVQLHYFIIGS